jgi:hypothetical protein
MPTKAKKNDDSKIDKKIKRAKCVVLQPFGLKDDPLTNSEINHDLIFNAIKNINNIRETFPIEVDRADGENKELEIHAHIESFIKDSDFCIADFTGNNPNVLYESGLAVGFRKSVIFISQDVVNIPFDVRKYAIIKYEMSALDKLPILIDRHLDRVMDEIDKEKIEKLKRVEYFSQRDDAEIRERIHNSKEKIDILQTNLSIIQANYIPDIIKALEKNKDLSIRMLTLNPQSIFVNFRGEQLEFKDKIDLYRGELETNLKTVAFQLKKFGNRVQIKLYDDFPTQIVFFFDDDVLVGVVSNTGRSRENISFLLSKGTPGVDKSFIEHFDKIWQFKSIVYKPYNE